MLAWTEKTGCRSAGEQQVDAGGRCQLSVKPGYLARHLVFSVCRLFDRLPAARKFGFPDTGIVLATATC